MLLALARGSFDPAVSSCEHDLELVHLVPLFLGTIALGNREQLLKTPAGVGWGWGWR